MKYKLLFYIFIFDAFLLAGLLLYFGFDWYWAILPFVALLGFLALACSKIQWNFFVPAIHFGDSSTQKIALTFDDGPHPKYTPQVLDILKKHGVKATFFMIGKNIQQYPILSERIINEGHTIGNHSFTHSKTIDFKNQNGWKKEIENTDLEIRKILGKNPRFFRPPYGVTTPHLAGALKKSGKKTIGWSQRTYDTMSISPMKIKEKIIKNLKSGDIILLHDTHENIVPLLEHLLPEIEHKNLSFATVNEMINEEPYF